MDSRNETPGELRERLRQAELKNNPSGAFGDGVDRAGYGSFADLTGGLGWKGLGALILLLIVGYVVYKLWF